MRVWSSLGGNSKDPVTLDTLFATLPDGITHLASATLEAKAKKVTRNMAFQKQGG